jgi:hypothetical protein
MVGLHIKIGPMILEKIYVEKYETDRPLGRPRRSWKDDIKVDLNNIGCEDVDGFIWLRLGSSGGLM